MDCQGTTDLLKSTPTLDNFIMFLALQLSDMHILNVKGAIRSDDFERLNVSSCRIKIIGVTSCLLSLCL